MVDRSPPVPAAATDAERNLPPPVSTPLSLRIAGVTQWFQRRDVFYREHAAHYYLPEAYSLSIFLAELPWVAGTTLMNISIAYWIAPLSRSAANFFFFW
jgi:ABC-type multidrug transport system permease subunit